MRRTRTWVAIFGALIVMVSGTGALDLSSAASAAGTPGTLLPSSKVKVTRAVPYTDADGTILTLDVYEPVDGGSGRPGLVLIHGGGWAGGQAKDIDEEGRLMAREGWVAFSVNYRLADDSTHTWPDALTDVQKAARWIGAHAGTYGADPQKIAALGVSAGGHLATLLGEIGTEVDGTGHKLDDTDPPVTIRAVAAWSAPTRLAGLVPPSAGGLPPDCIDDKACGLFWHLPLVQNFLGCLPDQCPDRYLAASPVSRVSTTSAPIWFANATNEIVGLPQAHALDQALNDGAVDHHFEVVPGSQHATQYKSVVWNKMMPWLAAHLGVAEPPPVSFAERSILLNPLVVISVVVGLALLIALLAVALRDDEGEL
jgi:acetyl esterase